MCHHRDRPDRHARGVEVMQAPPGPVRVSDADRERVAELRPLAAASASRLAPALPGGDVYTDDRAPVEWLIDASIVKVAADGER